MSELIVGRDIPLAKICGARDEALVKIRAAIKAYGEAYALSIEARELAKQASGGRSFYGQDRRNESTFRSLFHEVEAQETEKVFREWVDAGVWLRVMDELGMNALMDATALEEFHDQLNSQVPEVSEDNIRATIEGLAGDARLIFLRGLARAFSDLDRRFRSHDAFQLGNAKGGGRMVLQYVFDEHGHLRYGSVVEKKITDVERVFAVLDEQAPDPGGLCSTLREGRTGWGAKQTDVSSRYFRIKGYKNGNAHLWFTRPDLLQKANECLAEYYGEVLPDGVPREAPPEKTTALARDLAFYPTPEAVCRKLLDGVEVVPYRDEMPKRILEPSAGTGNILRAVLAEYRSRCGDWRRNGNPPAFPSLTAVEVHPDRVAVLRSIDSRINVWSGNFLAMRPSPNFDLILMNPPFVGTHWMAHVQHAFEFLAPSGILRAVVPVSCDLGTSSKHERFRAWAEQHRPQRSQRHWEDLPLESFAESGTRVSTGILTLVRRAS